LSSIDFLPINLIDVKESFLDKSKARVKQQYITKSLQGLMPAALLRLVISLSRKLADGGGGGAGLGYLETWVNIEVRLTYGI
jgi:hypothetical protein